MGEVVSQQSFSRSFFQCLLELLILQSFFAHQNVPYFRSTVIMVKTPQSVRYLIGAILIFTFICYHGSSNHSVRRRPLYYVKSSYDWSQLTLRHPPSNLIELPSGKPHSLPTIQHQFPHPHAVEQEVRRETVRKVFQKCWRNYRKYAWMRDELTPLSADGKDTFGGWAATLIDGLDTLWIMDLKEDFHQAVRAIATLDWADTKETACNMFETTIRHLGGLLSAYDLSGDLVLLDKAVELGDMLYAGFDTPNRMPPFWLDFVKAKEGRLVADHRVASASPASLSLEFTRLSQVTGDPKYYDAVARVTDMLDKHQNSTKLPGMWPTFVNMRDGDFTTEHEFTLGGLADSLYEYFPKMYALLGGREPVYEKLYRDATSTIVKHLLFRPMLPDQADILVSGTAKVEADDQIVLTGEGQHLTCFIGGMFALGGRLFEIKDHVDMGARLTRGCIYAYNAFPTGIMPEIFDMIPCPSKNGCRWDEKKWQKERTQKRADLDLPKGFSDARVRSYTLRPEAIESVFILYRITGLQEFQDAAWQMFEAIQNATETEFGNAAIEDVTSRQTPIRRDSMEVRGRAPFSKLNGRY